MMNKFTLVYKWDSQSKMQSITGKDAEVETHTAVIEAGNYKSAVTKLREHVTSTTLGRKIRIIGQVELK